LAFIQAKGSQFSLERTLFDDFDPLIRISYPTADFLISLPACEKLLGERERAMLAF
jgi:hypothetical protein